MQNFARRESTSSWGNPVPAKADHLTRVQQTARIVLLFRDELDVIGTEPATVFKIVDMRIGDKHTNRPAISNHVVQALLRRETHHGDCTGNDDAFSVFHKFNME